MKTKEFYELFSKAVLENFYPKIFCNLQKREKPDFANEYIGLEITLALEAYEGELKSLFENYKNKPYKQLPSKLLKKFGFQGMSNINDILYSQTSRKNGKLLYFYSKEKKDYILLGYISPLQSNGITVDVIMERINDKLEKLNSNYEIKNNNYLAILIQEQINYYGMENIFLSEIIDEILKKIKAQDISNKYEYVFDKIYLIFLDKIITINTYSLEAEPSEIPLDVYKDIYDSCK